MIAALLLGRGGSTGLPGKNVMPMLGRPLMSYPIMAAQNCKYIDNIFVSTDDAKIKGVAQGMGAKVIDRPAHLATKEALAEDAFRHGYTEIVKQLGGNLEFLVLLFCNGATVLSKHINEAVEALRANPNLDSACTTSSFNMWSPLRAKKINADGLLVPFIEPSYFGEQVNCDRGSQGDVWYADCSVFVVRPRCLEEFNGDAPFYWLGKKVHPIKQWGGLDIDYEWQVPMVDFWLKKHGFTEGQTPYDRK